MSFANIGKLVAVQVNAVVRTSSPLLIPGHVLDAGNLLIIEIAK
jgi:hypothetical protein